MDSVHSDGVDRMEIRQWLASRTAERHVPAKILYRAARFYSSHDVPSRQMLVFQSHTGLNKDSQRIQAPQHLPR